MCKQTNVWTFPWENNKRIKQTKTNAMGKQNEYKQTNVQTKTNEAFKTNDGIEWETYYF